MSCETHFKLMKFLMQLYDYANTILVKRGKAA